MKIVCNSSDFVVQLRLYESGCILAQQLLHFQPKAKEPKAKEPYSPAIII
jgi:hypothetical protein